MLFNRGSIWLFNNESINMVVNNYQFWEIYFKECSLQ